MSTSDDSAALGLSDSLVLLADQYFWGGAGGSSLWFNPSENLAFGYACTGFAAGINGDANRLDPINAALRTTPVRHSLLSTQCSDPISSPVRLLSAGVHLRWAAAAPEQLRRSKALTMQTVLSQSLTAV